MNPDKAGELLKFHSSTRENIDNRQMKTAFEEYENISLNNLK